MRPKNYAALCLTLCAAAVLLAQLLSRGAQAAQAMRALPDGQEPVIVIDAGHGGEDGGAVSPNGIYESHINLQIALRVRDFLHLLGLRTLLVRSEDVSVATQGATIAARKVSDIHNRVRLVEATPNALLVSIHQNHFPESKYRGAQVFYAAAGESRALAERLQSLFTTQVDPRNHRQCKPAENIYLMQHVSCTAVLVECGFLSNLQEEALLCDARYQKRLCAAVCVGIFAHLEAYK